MLIAGSPVQAPVDHGFQRNWTVDCDSVAEVRKFLKESWGEKLVAESSKDAYTIQIWENRQDGGTWSLVILDPWGYACLVVTGKGKWKFPLY